MTAIFSIEDPRSRTGFRETGTEGRSILRNADGRAVLRHAAKVSARWHWRAVRVEEHADGNIYAPPSRVWNYACACDLDAPCCFHRNTDPYTGITAGAADYDCSCPEKG